MVSVVWVLGSNISIGLYIQGMGQCCVFHIYNIVIGLDCGHKYLDMWSVLSYVLG